jgi:hypothetical protein
MANVICTVTDQHDFGSWPFIEHVSVTLTLLETAPDQFAVAYDATYSGLKDGRVAGGPVPVNGNGTWVVNPNPKVTVIVSNWSDDHAQHLISAHIKIVVDAPVLGTITIFDKSLGGRYGEDKLVAILAHMAEISKAAA